MGQGIKMLRQGLLQLKFLILQHWLTEKLQNLGGIPT